MTPQQKVKEVLQDYDVPFTEEDWMAASESDVQMGQDIKEMMETRGWKEWFYPMVDQLMQNLNTLEDVENVKQLEARKQTYKSLKLLFDRLNMLVDRANKAVIDLNGYKDSTQE